MLKAAPASYSDKVNSQVCLCENIKLKISFPLHLVSLAEELGELFILGLASTRGSVLARENNGKMHFTSFP